MGYKSAQDDLEPQLIEAISTVEARLGYEVVTNVHQHHGYMRVMIGSCQSFSVSDMEIARNNSAGLVNVVRTRLANLFYDMQTDVNRTGTYFRICHGTQPWVLVEGL